MPNRILVQILVDFARNLARAGEAGEMLPALAHVSREHLGVDAVAVLQLDTHGVASIVAREGLPDGFVFTADEDLVGEEVGEAVRCALGDRFAKERTLPILFGGDVYGFVVLLSRSVEHELTGERAELIEGLIGLAGAGMHRAARYAELQRSYAELRATRDALARGHKLRSLGQMAAGVAHDLKNILNPLSLHLQLLKRIVPRDSTDAQESIVEMQGVLRRGLDTIERLREFSRQTPPKRAETVTLEGLAREAIEICKPRMRAKHDAHYKLVEELAPTPMVMLVSSELVSAAVNLLVNAIDAMPRGGNLTMATGETEGGAFLRVRDDGPGMSTEVQQRIFEPFFTTKGDEGTGLGLAMVYAFVQRSRGKLTVETAPGEGATFEMAFPSAIPE